LRRRVERGASIFVAVAPREQGELGPTSLSSDGQYSELSDVAVLGTVDLSAQEMELPTHALSEGLYLSHMAVASPHRRRGLGVRLLNAAVEQAASQGARGVYLHVERANAGAIRLYEAGGFALQPKTPQHDSFTRALNLVHRDPLLMYRDVS